jgi:hypothetical protein
MRQIQIKITGAQPQAQDDQTAGGQPEDEENGFGVGAYHASELQKRAGPRRPRALLSRNDAVKELNFDRINRIYRIEKRVGHQK